MQNKVKPGDKLRGKITAQFFNTVIDITKNRPWEDRGGRPMGGVKSTVNWGKAVAGWTTGNSMVLTPIVSQSDVTPTGAANVTALIFSPGGTPANVQISINQPVAYVTAPDGTHILLNPNHGAFSGLGTLQYQVYQMTSTTAAGWDFVRASA